MTHRLFAGGISTETNVLSPLPTGLADYRVSPATGAQEDRSLILGGSTFARYAAIAAERGHSYIQGGFAAATPAGVTTRAAYETLRESLLGELEAARPLDGVLLTLHGAMVADGYEDCETDLVGRVREIVGAQVKIGVLLDLHCDIPDELVDTADAIVTFKEYPHVDIDERAVELANLVCDAIAGQSKPVMATFDCRMIGVYPTSREPMSAFVKVLKSAEQRPGILSVSLGHGFPWGDAPAIGARMLVISDGDAPLAETTAAELGREFYALRRKVTLKPVPMRAALDRALSSSSGGPIVLADVADNPGGGAPSDSTFALRELLVRDVEDAAVALLWDPVVVQQAFAAGPGASLKIRLGGKMGPSSGDPLDLTVRVRSLVPNLVQRWPQNGIDTEVPCGESACLTCDGIDVIVSSRRQQVLGLEAFSAFGIDPTAQRLLIVKSTNHFYAAFGPIAAEVIYMSTSGALTFATEAIPYQHMDARMFPWVDDPLGSRSHAE